LADKKLDICVIRQPTYGHQCQQNIKHPLGQLESINAHKIPASTFWLDESMRFSKAPWLCWLLCSRGGIWACGGIAKIPKEVQPY
jgi:hypothetical protein